MKNNNDSSQFLSSLEQALKFHRDGDRERARSIYLKLLQADPSHSDLLRFLGIAEFQLGNWEQCILHLRRSAEIAPHCAETHNALGTAYKALGRLDEALVSFTHANLGQPDYVEAYINRGLILKSLGRYDEAIECFDRALILSSVDAEIHNHRGLVMHAKGCLAEAIASYDRALAYDPGLAEAYNNRGVALKNLMRYDEALRDYDQALTIQPDYIEALSNRGVALKALNRFEEAVASYDRVLTLYPAYAEAHSNRGIALQELKRLEEAWDAYQDSIRLNPDYAEAHWNKALLLILLGRYEQGWGLFEWRWLRNEAKAAGKFRGLPWLGQEPIAGKTLLVYPEQGLGDYLQFCRYAPLVEALGAKVILEAPPVLVPVLATLPGNITIIATGEPLPPYDALCPVMSLPLAFKTTIDTIPATVPYLATNPAKVAEWQGRLGPRTQPRIGLVWSGNPTHKNDHNRSLRFDQLEPLLELPYEYHCLQKDIREEDRIILQRHPQVQLHADNLRDFSDTAALVDAMDLVISVDTSVAHLAGALGKPLWLLLPYMPDYRWMLDRSDSPWYPTARLFRQPEIGDWDKVVTEVQYLLPTWASSLSYRAAMAR
jgi:tetratricopeptide (TPR) repeat protein